MRDCLELGPTPCNENCAQVGIESYHVIAKQECQRYIDLIRKVVGPEPEGARLRIKSNPHDFGTYYEVACYFDDTNETAIDYAYHCEANLPANWE